MKTQVRIPLLQIFRQRFPNTNVFLIEVQSNYKTNWFWLQCFHRPSTAILFLGPEQSENRLPLIKSHFKITQFGTQSLQARLKAV